MNKITAELESIPADVKKLDNDIGMAELFAARHLVKRLRAEEEVIDRKRDTRGRTCVSQLLLRFEALPARRPCVVVASSLLCDCIIVFLGDFLECSRESHVFHAVPPMESGRGWVGGWVGDSSARYRRNYNLSWASWQDKVRCPPHDNAPIHL